MSLDDDPTKDTTRKLAFVFDIDGTLIGETKDLYAGVQIRPHTVQFLRWCQGRGHRLALWTVAHVGWANRIAKIFCEELHPNHDCQGRKCRQTFDFVWDRRHLRTDRHSIKQSVTCNDDDKCCWCDMYSSRCDRCYCINYPYYPGACPCRKTKDLRRIWHREWYGIDNSDGEITHHFKRENTLILENTPQNCRYNYGNGIYVPTYRGGCMTTDKTFEGFQEYVEGVLEKDTKSVRDIQKCDCTPPRTPHACFRQVWWPHTSQNK
jgi:NLI interacting factor-like phosphatase